MFPWLRRKQPSGTSDQELAQVKLGAELAARELEVVKARRPAVHNVSVTINRHLERNGFGEALRSAIGGK